MNTHTGKDCEFFQALKDRVYDEEFKELNEFEYSCFKFKFKLDNLQYQKEFSNFLHYNDPLMPWDVCNFFCHRGLSVRIYFRYCKEIGLKANFVLFKTVLFLQKEMVRLYCTKKFNSIRKKIL